MWVIVATMIVVVVIVVAGYAVLERGSGASSSPQGTVILPAGTLYSIPFDQYNAIVLTVTAPVTVSGTITNVGGAEVYLMNFTQYRTLYNTDNVTHAGYEWTTGPIQSNTYYDLKVSVPVGAWDLVFANSVYGNSTAIGFYTNLVETP